MATFLVRPRAATTKRTTRARRPATTRPATWPPRTRRSASKRGPKRSTEWHQRWDLPVYSWTKIICNSLAFFYIYSTYTFIQWKFYPVLFPFTLVYFSPCIGFMVKKFKSKLWRLLILIGEYTKTNLSSTAPVPHKHSVIWNKAILQIFSKRV